MRRLSSITGSILQVSKVRFGKPVQIKSILFFPSNQNVNANHFTSLIKYRLVPWNNQNEAQVPLHGIEIIWSQSNTKYFLGVQNLTHMITNLYPNAITVLLIVVDEEMKSGRRLPGSHHYC